MAKTLTIIIRERDHKTSLQLVTGGIETDEAGMELIVQILKNILDKVIMDLAELRVRAQLEQ